MDCLDANAVQDLMSGALDATARTAVIGHLDTCGDCRQLLGVSARDVLRDGRSIALADTRASDSAIGDVALAATMARPLAVDSIATTGTQIGRYKVIDQLGAGAMGIVYRADDPQLGRAIALKQLRHPDPALTERLVREAQAMAQVSHPNVVAVYDVGVADGSTYIAMELVRGKSLRAWQNEQRHSIAEIVEAYLAAGRGLAAAHAAGIVHRDFKPDNVLVGDDGRVRVTDFGLASAKPSPGGRPSGVGDLALTAAGSVLGTPAYMAPEQFTTGNVDPRTDQFNFCVALYEALYGGRPFAGKTFTELGDNVCEGKLLPAPAGARVSGALRAIVVRGLAVKPGDRFPSMDHLLAELGRDRARPWRRGATAAAALAGVLALGFAADVVVRERVALSSRRSFETTGAQIERAAGLQAKLFLAVSTLVKERPALLEVSANRDNADFGLATAEDDAAKLAHLHDELKSTDWDALSNLGQQQASALAVVDYKGRLLYTNVAPDAWRGDLTAMPEIKRALDASKGEFVSIVRYDHPAFVAASVFGASPRRGLAMMFARTLDHNGERGGVFFQLVDGADLLSGIKLDDTQLALVAPDGTSIGDVSDALVGAVRGGDVSAVRAGGTSYQVQARELLDFARQPIGRVVMARPIGGVLSELFPGARTTFAIAALVAFAAAIAMTLSARRIAGALG